jgi:hypothetical protein
MPNTLDRILMRLWIYRGFFWFVTAVSITYALVVSVYLGMRWIAFDPTNFTVVVLIATDAWIAFYFSLVVMWRWSIGKVAAEIVPALDKTNPDWPTALEESTNGRIEGGGRHE